MPLLNYNKPFIWATKYLKKPTKQTKQQKNHNKQQSKPKQTRFSNPESSYSIDETKRKKAIQKEML